ncbi:MAG: thioredoxin domain-containing protein [Puia sp.]
MSKLRIPVNEKDHRAGNASAKVILVEYGDYQCPHCGIAHPLLKRLLKNFGKDMLFVFRNFPLQEAHPAATIAATSAEAADLQDKFWEMHDLIFEHQDDLYELDETGMAPFAEKIKLDMKKFAKDVTSDAVIARVENDFEGGVRSGVNGTPDFFINGNRLNSYDATYDSLADAVISLV